MHWNRRILSWAIALVVTAPLAADDKTAPAAQPEMGPEEKAMMEAMIKAGTPGPEHAWLAAQAGNWQFKGKSWMKPDGPASEFEGTEERTMILGGRVMMAKVVSAFEGMAFEGLGLSGFDNVTRKWWGSWNDSMTCGSMTVSGACADGKCEYESWAADPLTGKMTKGRMTAEHHGDHEIHLMYSTGPDGKEFKMMEFHYTRKK